MKNMFISKTLSVLVLAAVSSMSISSAMAADADTTSTQSSGLLKDFDTLGGNDVLLEKAQALNPEAQIRIVQDRVVTRRSRVEIAPEFSSVLGGDAYNRTSNIGLNTHYHFTPQWSLGLKYNYSFNTLRPEGENLLTDVSVDGKARIPDIDFPKQQASLTLNWYPIYGKMNLYELGVVHFDVYALAGAGQVELKSGWTTSYTGGAGIGLWVSQHLSTRFELRYEGYTAKRFTGDTQMNTTIAGIQVGYLL